MFNFFSRHPITLAVFLTNVLEPTLVNQCSRLSSSPRPLMDAVSRSPSYLIRNMYARLADLSHVCFLQPYPVTLAVFVLRTFINEPSLLHRPSMDAATRSSSNRSPTMLQRSVNVRTIRHSEKSLFFSRIRRMFIFFRRHRLHSQSLYVQFLQPSATNDKRTVRTIVFD